MMSPEALEQMRLRERYERDEATDAEISSLPEPTQEALKKRRAEHAASRARYEAKQAEAGRQRERELEAAFLAGGGTSEQWSRERDTILAADRAERTRARVGASRSLVDLRRII